MSCTSCDKLPEGYVKAKRLRGRGQGSYGVARAGDVVLIPEDDATARPDLWEIIKPEPELAELPAWEVFDEP